MSENFITMSNPELRKMLDGMGYSRLFNAIADATTLEWGGTAIGISVEKFIKSLTGLERNEDSNNES